MRCHQHLDQEAVAVCVSCGRAVCRNCQHFTFDQRVLCGMPQCEVFAHREKAMLNAVQQGCAHRAAAWQSISRVLLTVCVATIVALLLSGMGFFGWAILVHRMPDRDAAYFLIQQIIVMMVPIYFLLRSRTKLAWQQNSWQDLVAPFEKSEERHKDDPAATLASRSVVAESLDASAESTVTLTPKVK